jgi:HEAT repeat protein
LLYLKSSDESCSFDGSQAYSEPNSPDPCPPQTLFSQAKADLKHPDPKIRILAVQFLERAEASTSIPLLQEMVKDRDPGVRAQAVSSLIKFRNPDLSPLLRKSLKDSDPWVRIASLRGLFENGERIDSNTLIQLLSDESPLVRRKVATLLGWSRIEGVFPILMEMSRDQDAKVRKAALFSLLTLYPEESESRVAEAVADGDPDLRRWARETLERAIGYPAERSRR